MFELLNTTTPIELDSPYQYNGNSIPRVTSILSEMLHEDYLMEWANNVGLYQRKKHTYYSDLACNIGDYAHRCFEIAVRDRITDIRLFPFQEVNIPTEIYSKVHNCLASFIMWWKNLVDNHTVEVLMQETTLICQYYGGTVDCVLKIDGEIYIIDYKSSNYPSYKYHLQLAAYKIILETVYHLNVDGAIILLLNKNKVSFEEQFMNFKHYVEHATYMQQLTETFLSLVYAYYNRKLIELQYKNYIERLGQL